MPVTVNFSGFLVMRDLVRPGQIGKCPLLMERMSVEGNGLNRLVCRKSERSALVDFYWMALQARFFGLLVVWSCGGGFGGRGVVQRPLV